MKTALSPAKDKEAAQALFTAAGMGDLSLVKKLMQGGAETGFEKGDITLAMKDLDRDAMNIFKMLNLHGIDEVLNAALYMAAFNGHAPVVDYFLEQGECTQKTLDVALFGAVRSGSETLVEKLVAAGAKPESNDSASIVLAISLKKQGLADYLMEGGKGTNAAMVAYLEAEDFEHFFGTFGGDINPLDGIKAITRRLSERSVTGLGKRDKPLVDKYLDAFDNLVSYAQGHGDDMQALVHKAMTYAVDQWSPHIIGKLVKMPAFDALDSMKPQLDAALSLAGMAVFRGFGLDTELHLALAESLLEKGANPQIALSRGIEGDNADMVTLGLKSGADPRRDGYVTLRSAKTRAKEAQPMFRESANAILALVEAEEKRLDEADYASLKSRAKDGITPAMLRETDAEGRTGLMAAVAAGQGAEALRVFKSSGAALTADELLAADKSGYTALNLFSDRGQATLLIERDLWLMREEEYKRVYDKIPESLRENLQEQHQHVLNSLKAHRDALALRQQREADKNRFKLK